MKWEDYDIDYPKEISFEPRQQVDVECPECGKKIFRRNDMVLTTYPPQYRYECDCGWWGSAFK